jgi:hypothetical protein
VKKLLIGVVIVLVLIGAIVAVVFYLTGDLTRSADRFLTLIREGKTKEAYLSTAREFQAATPEDSFLAFLKSSSVADYESATWSSRSLSNNIGELEGSIKTRGGGTIPIKLKLVKEGGEWRILAIEKAAAGLVATSTTPALPADEELRSLTNSSVQLLARAINNKDFAEFYGATSKIWQGQTNPGSLKEAFKSFIDQNIDLTFVEGRSPEFSEKPLIDDSGRLILKGYYPTQPSRLNFTVKFVRQESEWKLIGINVSVEDAPTAPSPPAGKKEMPPDDQLAALTNQSVMLLAQSVSKDDFSELYNSIAKVWQKQMTREELRNEFKDFIDKKIPLTIIKGTAPVFSEKPYFDSSGMLILNGQYPSKPFRVEFRLAFLNEESTWRLAAVNVSTRSQ